MSDQVESNPIDSGLTLFRLRLGLRWGVVLVNLVLPLVAQLLAGGFLLEFHPAVDGTVVLYSVIGYTVAVLGACFTMLYTRRIKSGLFCGFILSLLVIMLIWNVFGASGQCVVMLMCVLFAFVRLHKLYHTVSLSNLNLNMFRLDSVILVIVGSLFALSKPTTGNGAVELINEAFALFLVFYAVLRVATLWGLERVESKIRSSSPLGLYVMFGLSIVIALWGPFALGHLTMLFLALVAGIGLSIVLLLPAGLHFPQLHWKGLSSLTSHQNLSKVKPHHEQLLSHAQSQWILALVLTVMVIVTARIILKMRNKTIEEAEYPSEAETVQTVRRTWLFKNQGVQYLPTNEPIRLRFQAMLKRLERRGIQMSRQDTARGFVSRVANHLSDEENRLIEAYEKVRYGKDTETRDRP